MTQQESRLKIINVYKSTLIWIQLLLPDFSHFFDFINVITVNHYLSQWLPAQIKVPSFTWPFCINKVILFSHITKP